jgi:hypothetical protein
MWMKTAALPIRGSHAHDDSFSMKPQETSPTRSQDRIENELPLIFLTRPACNTEAEAELVEFERGVCAYVQADYFFGWNAAGFITRSLELEI